MKITIKVDKRGMNKYDRGFLKEKIGELTEWFGKDIVEVIGLEKEGVNGKN